MQERVKPRKRLIRKYVALFMAVVSAALLASGGLEIWFSYRENMDFVIQLQREKAETAATRIGQFVREIEGQLGWTTQLPWSTATMDQRRFDALRLLRQVPAVTELTQIDGVGREQLRVSRLAMDIVASGADISAESRFTEALARRVYHGQVYFRRESEPYMTLSVAGNRRDAGVSVAEVNLKFIWDVVTQIKLGAGGYAYVLDAGGRLIAHPDISLVLRNTNMGNLPQILAARRAEPSPARSEMLGLDPGGREVIAAHAAIPALGWIVVVEQPLSEAMAPLYRSATRTGILLLIGLVIAFFAGLLLARRMAVPIQAIQAVAAEVGRGDLGRRIALKTGDEIEDLADQFNDMAGRLQESYADLERKVLDRTRELTDALDQQTALGDILRVIASSPTDINPVLAAVAESAARLCDAFDAVIFLREGDALAVAKHHGPIAVHVTRIPISRDWVTGRAVLERQLVHVHDLIAAGDEYPEGRTLAIQHGHRTIVSVPLLKDREPIGAIMIRRTEVRPFSEKQIALLRTFSDQAVIAIENVRLFDEVRQRTDELSESLQHQTATAEILKVISRSLTETQPVFDAIVRSGLKLFPDATIMIALPESDWIKVSAIAGRDQKYVEALNRRFPIPLSRDRIQGAVVLDRTLVDLADATEHTEGPLGPGVRNFLESGYRAITAMPMMRGEFAIGAISVIRVKPGPLSDKQIALLRTFADQAVIAIENVRLFDEVRQRTDELSESLQHQTATAEILKVISRSLTETQPVFDAIVQSGLKLFPEATIMISLPDGVRVRAVAVADRDPERVKSIYAVFPIPLARNRMNGLAILDRTLIDIPDALEQTDGPFTSGIANFLKTGNRAITVMPMIRGEFAIGAISVIRASPGPLSEKQIALLRTFSDQAVIAIENVRLFEEVQARTRELARSVEELTALGAVGQAVSATLDLKTVLDTIAEKAVALTHTEACGIHAYDEASKTFILQTAHGLAPLVEERLRQAPVKLGDGAVGQAALRKEPVQFPDIEAVPDYPVRSAIMRAGYRALLAAPLAREDRIVGAIVVLRKAPGEFAPETVALLQNFASQSTLAIQNARLFREIEEKGRQLQVASQHKSQFLANMSHELRTPLNAILGYTELIQDSIYGEVPQKVTDVLVRVQANSKHLLGLINEVLDLSKIEAGQFALSISDYAVPGMIQTVVSATESLARNKGLDMRTQLADALPIARGDERRLTQVLLNLVGNAIKFTDKGTVEIAARAAGERLLIEVQDTGPGIAAADQARIFEEFQQVDNSNTRAKGGTGLGLAISKKIVELHGGSIRVESEPGVGSTFTIDLPIRADAVEPRATA
jgi:signal transduction histidine kinase